MNPVKIGIVGCGNICDIYFENIAKFKNIEVYACADLAEERARLKADQYGCKSMPVDALMQDPQVEIVLNLTIPQAHFEIDQKALQAGKHVYSEKPLAIEMDDARKIMELAGQKGLLVGCAPDTFLGARHQTIKKLIDDGWIGRPVAAAAFMTCHGHENWHPNPEFYYKNGAGPLFDMGPYYFTALVSMLGPVKRISGAVSRAYQKRLITSQPLAGREIAVEVPTHVSGNLEFQNGVIATIIMSFDIWDTFLPRYEVYGTDGTISMTDPDPLAGPDIFHGETKLRRKDASDWLGDPSALGLPRKEEITPWDVIPPCYGYNCNSRGLGLSDMARAVRQGGNFRANGQMAFHVLEIMHGLYASAESGAYYSMTTTCDIPELMPVNLPEYSMSDEKK